MKINHNISAQVANISLKKANNNLSASLEKLSTGYKINKAADDAAGIAISNKMRTQIRALDQASRNADDGISVIQTAEGALSEIETMLQRMRELSVQAANDTYILEDRESMQSEIDSLMEEVDRIAGATEFNGNGLLDGSKTRVVTYDVNGLSNLSISEGVDAGVYTYTIDQLATQTTCTLTNFTDGEVTINGNTFVVSSDTQEAIQAITEACDAMGIDVTYDGNTPGSLTLTARAYGSNQRIEATDTTGETVDETRGQDVVLSLGDGFSDNVSQTSNGQIVTIEDSSGFKMVLSVEDTAKEGETVTMTVYDEGKMILQIGANEHQTIAVDFPEVSCRTLGLSQTDGTSLVNVCSQKGATEAIDLFDAAIRSVSASRSSLGAYENRLDSTVASLDATGENMTSAMSRIVDTDMADSMVDYTEYNVLVQAATAMLAQANNRPEQVMSLLQM